MLDHSTLRMLLHYEPETGVFTWRERSRENFKSDRAFKAFNGRFAGTEAGCVSDAPYGSTIQYRLIGVRGKLHKAHRLAWFYMTGAWPSADVDHKDRNGLNNAWHNLREASRTQNLGNQKCQVGNGSGFKGVSLIKSTGQYGARIQVKGERHWLGSFDSAEAAHDAYYVAAKKYFGEFARGKAN